MTALRVYFYFLKTLLLRSRDIKYRITIDSLFKSHSYRTPKTLNKHKAPFVFYLKSIRLIFFKNKKELKNNKPAMFCLLPKNIDYCYTYLVTYKKDATDLNIIVRDAPITSGLSFFDKLTTVTINSFLCFYVFICSFFKQNSNKMSLLPLELTESLLLLSTVQKYKIPYVYFFSAYEKDANWIALLLQHNKIYCQKIPSSNPIKNFYSATVSDKFSFTAPFQIYEYPQLKNNWCVNEFEQWPIFGSHNFLNHVIEKKGKAPEKSIGIYTRGVWLRKKRGEVFLGVGEDVAEENMLVYLKEFLIIHSEYSKVYVLMHPIEKDSVEQYQESVNYYKNYFNSVNIQFIEAKTPSYELFNMFDLGIASISSVMFERLFCGYKCLLAPIGVKVKLYEDPNLENIIIKHKDEFFSKMKSILEMAEVNYFKEYNLQSYRLREIEKITF